jgi:EmrB/QacA subfamily drug resistance transporter
VSSSPRDPNRRPSALTLLVAGVFFMEFLDGSIIATALPRMAPALHSTPVALNIGISAYLLTVAICILPSGWAADRFGPRPVFTTAIVVFVLGSICCGLSTSAPVFVASRVLQGIGGAMMVPVGRLTVLRATPKEGLMDAIAMLTWPGLTAPVIAPPIGGFLAEYASWRWIFFINLPLGAIALGLALLLVPRGGAAELRPFDLVGFLLAALSLLAATLMLDALGGVGNPAWRPLALALLLAALLVALRRHLIRHEHPLFAIEAFRIPTFRSVMLGGSAIRTLINTQPFLLPLLFQLGYGLDAFHAGLTVIVLFVGNLGIKPLTSPILRRWGFRRVMVASGLVQAAAMLATATLVPLRVLPLTLLILLVSGAARSMQFTAVNTLAFADVPPRLSSSANTMFSVAFQLGIGFGVALGAVMLRTATALRQGGGTPALGSFNLALVAIAALTVLVSLDSLRLAPDAGAVVAAGRRRA